MGVPASQFVTGYSVIPEGCVDRSTSRRKGGREYQKRVFSFNVVDSFRKTLMVAQSVEKSLQLSKVTRLQHVLPVSLGEQGLTHALLDGGEG